MEEREGKKIKKKDNWIKLLVEEEWKFEAGKCINGGQKSLGVCRRSKRKLGKWKKYYCNYKVQQKHSFIHWFRSRCLLFCFKYVSEPNGFYG